MNNILPYYFTVYGEVYTGEELFDLFPNHKIVIQRDKFIEFQNMKDNSLETIKRFGWALPNCTLTDCLRINTDEYFEQEVENQDEYWYGDFDRRIMFVIGAGASANCVTGSVKSEFENSISRPPLGIQLFKKEFEEIYHKYPGVIYSLHNLQGDHAIDVETLFESEWHEISTYANREFMARHINIQYYLQELMHHISYSTLTGYGTENLFAKLCDKLQQLYYRNAKRKFAFVSFNYDTILELFLSRYFSIRFNSIEDYVKINDGPISVFKPHGSWNWGWKFPNQEDRNITMAQWLFQEKICLHDIYYKLLGNYKEMVDWKSYGFNYRYGANNISKFNVNKSKLSVIVPGNENNYFPALLLPYRDKDEFTMPSKHYWYLESYLPYVETLIIIGWKGNEKLFNELVQRSGNKISKIVIADPCPEVVEKNIPFLKDKGTEIKYYNGGFEDFIFNGLENEIQFPE